MITLKSLDFGIYTFTGSGISSFHLNNFGIKHVLINSNPSYFFRNDLWLGEICVGDPMECQYRDSVISRVVARKIKEFREGTPTQISMNHKSLQL